MTTEEEYLARHYATTIFQYEKDRLERHSPAEYGVTCRYLRRYLPKNAVVADVGVGVGHYAVLIAQQGCSVFLVDICPALLEAALERLKAAGVSDQIKAAHHASATALDCLEADSLDALLMFGPFYHLRSLEERTQAVKEASRVRRPQGVLFAAGVNRMAYLRDLFRDHPEQVVARRSFTEST